MLDRFIVSCLYTVGIIVIFDIAIALGAPFMLAALSCIAATIFAHYLFELARNRIQAQRDAEKARRNELTDEVRHKNLSEIAARVKAERLAQEGCETRQ